MMAKEYALPSPANTIPLLSEMAHPKKTVQGAEVERFLKRILKQSKIVPDQPQVPTGLDSL